MLSRRRKPEIAKNATNAHKAVSSLNSTVPTHEVTLHVTLELLASAAQSAISQQSNAVESAAIPGEPPIVYSPNTLNPTEQTTQLYEALDPLLKVVAASRQYNAGSSNSSNSIS